MAGELRLAHDGGAAVLCRNLREQVSCQRARSLLIPAGTIHCSGRNSMGARNQRDPYIFTFKLWDLGAARLNGLAAAAFILSWNRKHRLGPANGLGCSGT